MARGVVRFAVLRRGNPGILESRDGGRVRGDHPPGRGADGRAAAGDELGLHQLDGPAGAQGGGHDLELAAGDQPEDFIAEPRHAHILAGLMPGQGVGHDAGGGGHVLLVFVPGALGVDGGAEPPAPRTS